MADGDASFAFFKTLKAGSFTSAITVKKIP
jgi:hypothetical protein